MRVKEYGNVWNLIPFDVSIMLCVYLAVEKAVERERK